MFGIAPRSLSERRGRLPRRAGMREYRPEVLPLEGRNLLSTVYTSLLTLVPTGSSLVVSGTFREPFTVGRGLEDGGLTFNVTDRASKSLLPNFLTQSVFTVPGSVTSTTFTKDATVVSFSFTIALPSGGSGGPYQLTVRDTDPKGNSFRGLGAVDSTGHIVTPEPQTITPTPAPGGQTTGGGHNPKPTPALGFLAHAKPDLTTRGLNGLLGH